MNRIAVVLTLLAYVSCGHCQHGALERSHGVQYTERQLCIAGTCKPLQVFAQLLLGFQNPTFLTFRKKGTVTVGLGLDGKPTEVKLEPTCEDGTPVYGAVAVPMPMGMVFQDSERFPGRFEIFQVKPKSNAAAAGLRPGDLIRASSIFSTDSQCSLFTADDQSFDALAEAIGSNSEDGNTLLVIERDIALLGTLRVCTRGMTCSKASLDVLELLRAIASTHKGISLENEEQLAEVGAAELQVDFIKEVVASSGCMNHCGGGVSVYNSLNDQVVKNVNSAPAGLTLLKSIGLDIPPAAGIAYLRRMNAKKKVDEGNLDEALTLLTDAIKAASGLKAGGAALTRLLYEARADLHKRMGDSNAAEEDLANAESMTELRYPTTA